MPDLHLAPKILLKKLIKKIIFIGGSSRSGTSLMGKIIGSAKNSEYFFEPPSLFFLIQTIDLVNKKLFKNYFENLLFRQLYLERLSQRDLNLNKNEDSYIYNYKEKKPPKSFFFKNYESMKFPNIIIKIPDSDKFLVKLKKIYPEIKLVYMYRNKYENALSIYKKRWYSNNPSKINRLFPLYQKSNNLFPNWLESNYTKKWLSLSEKEKSIFHVTENHKFYKKKKKLFDIAIYFNDLEKNSYKKIYKKLSLQVSKKTIENSKKIKIIDKINISKRILLN